MMESIGQLLQQARQARGISMEQAAQATHIRLHYLQAMEADDFNTLPSPVQARGFLRLYAGYLGLNPDALQPAAAQPQAAQPPASQPAADESALAQPPVKGKKFAFRLPGLKGKSAPAAEEIAPGDTDLADDSGPDEAASGEENAAGAPGPERGEPSAGAPDPAEQADPGTDAEAAPPTKTRPEPAAAAPQKTNYLVGPARPVKPASPPGGTTAPLRGAAVSNESHAILREIGQVLAQRREVLSLSLADIEHYTHVRTHYVLALEEGRIEEFLSPVQARGMLSNYARFMNLEVDALLLRFADALQTRRVENLSPQKAQRPPAQVAPRFSLRRIFTVDLVAGSLLIIAMVAFLFWGVSQVLDYRSSLDATPSLPAVVDVLSPSDTPTLAQTPGETDATQAALTGTPGQATPSTTPTAQATLLVTVPPGAASSSLQLYVIAREQVWLRVVVDGGTAFQGRTAAGAAYNFAGSKEITLTTGNAAGLQVLFNQSDLGVLGGYAEVVNLVFDANGVQTATPLPTLTRTATPLVSPTLGSPAKTGTLPAGAALTGTPTAGAKPSATVTPRPTATLTPTP